MTSLEYVRTLIWARQRRPKGQQFERPYWKGIELAMLAIQGRGALLPETDTYTLLEFGVAAGRSLETLCRFRDVLKRRLGIRQRIVIAAFDTFEGLPERRPEDIAAPWIPGDFAHPIQQVASRVDRFEDVELVEGLFSDTLPAWRDRLSEHPPLFVSVDCDYYSSTVDVLEVVAPAAPSGCMFYFDDAQTYYWSDQAGEMQAVRELNEGRFGEHLALSEYPLWIETGEIRHYRTLFRLLNLERGGFTMGRPLTQAELDAGY